MALDELPPERDPWKDEGHSELDEWIRRTKDALWRAFKKRSPGPASSSRRPQWKRSLPWAAVLLLGAWLASGLSSVTPGQVALLYAFGYPVREVHHGNFWNWPTPLGRVIFEDPSKQHSRYVVFHTFTKQGLPVLVTIHYRYQTNHPHASILFAPHPGLWLRGLLMSALTRWTIAHDRVVRSPREPQRQPVLPSVARLRSRINQVLLKEQVGLVLVHLGISIVPGRAVRVTWKEWKQRTAHEQTDARTLARKLGLMLVRQNRQALQRVDRVGIRIQRWIGQAKILVARFHALLPVYRRHPTLVRQTLIHALYERPLLPVSSVTSQSRSDSRSQSAPGRRVVNPRTHSERGAS